MTSDERKKLRQAINDVTTSPWERFQYKCYKVFAWIGIIAVSILLLNSCEPQAAIDWWNGK